MTITSSQRTQIEALTVGMFAAAPGGYLNEFESFVAAGGSVLDLADALANTTVFRSSPFYPPLLTRLEGATKFVDNLLSGATVADGDRAWAVTWVVDRLNAGESVGKVCYDAVAALDAVGDPVKGYGDSGFGSAAHAFDNRVAVADYFSTHCGSSTRDISPLQFVLKDITSDPATVDKEIASLSVCFGAPNSIALTAASEEVNGTAGNDTFIGLVNDGSVSSPTTLQSETDVIDGGPGLNKLQVTVQNQSTAYITPNATNVQALQVNDQSGSAWDLYEMPQIESISSVGSLEGTTFSYVKHLISTITIDRPLNTNAADLSISTNPSVAPGQVTLNMTDVSRYGGAWRVDEHDYYGNGLMSSLVIQSAGDNTHLVLDGSDQLETAQLVGGAGGKFAFQLTDYSAFTSLDASQYQGDLSAVFTNDPSPVTVRLGGGSNFIDLAAGNGLNNNNVITLGSGIDIVKIRGIPANGHSYDSVAGLGKGDTLDLSAVNLGASTLAETPVVLAATAVFQDYLDAICAGSAPLNGAFGWFRWSGDTYLVEDRSAAASFQSGTDFVIKLAGLVDLGLATGTGAGGAYGGDGVVIGG